MLEGHEFAPKRFIFPDITKERGEFDRVATKYGLNSETLQFIASEEGSLQDLPTEIWERLDNTESKKLQKDDWEAVRKISEKHDRDYEDLKKKMENNMQLDAPIIMKYDGQYHLVSGNTRLMVARALGITPQVLIFEYIHDRTNEND